MIFNKLCYPLLIGNMVLILAACQHPMKKTANPVATDSQIKQLASLVAASEYLKYQCNRSDIPADDEIIRAAFRSAEKRGWDTRLYYDSTAPGVVGQSLVAKQGAAFYQSLLKDGTPKQTQCSEFNRMMPTFIDTISKQ